MPVDLLTVLGASDYNKKIATLLQDKAYGKLKWIPRNL
jgi:hypothetical protein